MSKVVHFYQPGGPEVQRLKHITVASPAPNEVRLRVTAIGVNRSDLIFRAGMHPHQPVAPACNGSEAAGIVDAIGAGVSGFAIGDPVTMVPHMDPGKGTYCELINLPARLVMHQSSALSGVEAAAFWVSYLTAYGGLIETSQLAAGDYVLLPAAASSVGLAAIQIANAVGATPIAITRSETKVERLLAADAAHVLVAGRDDIAACTRDISGGSGARVVFDPVGGTLAPALAAGMAQRGIYVLYGVLAGEITPFPVAEAFEKLIAMTVFRLDYANQLADFRAARAFLDDLLARGLVKPRIERIFDFDDVVAAHRYMESDQHFGKLVLAL